MISKVRGSMLYGAMVIAMEEAQKLGRVSDVFIDRPSKRLLGIAYKSNLLGSDKEVYIESGDILKFSKDVIIVANQWVGRQRPGGVTSSALRALKGGKITTQTGTHIAVLADVVFDSANGQVIEVLLPENLKLDIDIDKVVFGHDLVMVPADYEPSTIWIEPETKAFINRIFTNIAITEKLREGYEEAKSSVRNNVNREKVVQSLKTGSRKAKATITRTSQAIYQAFDQISKKRQAVKREKEFQAEDADSSVTGNGSEGSGNTDSSAANGYESTKDEQGTEKT